MTTQEQLDAALAKLAEVTRQMEAYRAERERAVVAKDPAGLLLEAQARCVELRAVLDWTFSSLAQASTGPMPWVSVERFEAFAANIRPVLARPADRSALDAAIAEARAEALEEAAVRLETTSISAAYSVAAGRLAADAVRALVKEPKR